MIYFVNRWPCGNTLIFDASARYQLPDAAFTSLTYATILSESAKCEATSRPWMTAVENGGCKCSWCGGSVLEGITRVGDM